MVLALLGSGEFLPWARAVDAWLAETATAPTDRALVLPTAAAPEGEDVFQRWGTMGLEHYRALGLSPEIVGLRTREDAHDPAVVDRVAGARVIFFSGGNPGFLAETLRGTPFWEAVLDALANGSGLGGCSAGSVAFGALAPDTAGDPPWRFVDGLGLLPRAYVLAHYDAIDRWMPGARARFLARRPEGCIAVGIDEDTALCGDGERWHVRGAGAVWLSDDGSEPRPVHAGGDVVVRMTDEPLSMGTP